MCEGRKLGKTKLALYLCFLKMQHCALKASINLMNRYIFVSSHYNKTTDLNYLFFSPAGLKKKKKMFEMGRKNEKVLEIIDVP